MAISRSNLLYYLHPRIGGFEPLVGGGQPSYARDGPAHYVRAGERYGKAVAGEVPVVWLPHSDFPPRQPVLQVDQALTPDNDDSVLFTSGSAWTRQNVSSEESRPSFLDDLPTGGEARQFTSTSSDFVRVRQDIGTFSGSLETLTGVFERVDQGQSGLLAADTSATGNPGFVLYDWSADSVSLQSGSWAARQILTESGPNGGRVVRLILVYSGTSGNSRAIELQPDRDTAAQRIGIVHHGQFEETYAYPTAPVAHVGTPATRDSAFFTVPNGPRPGEWVGYAAFVSTSDSATGLNNSHRLITHGSFDDPRAHIFQSNDGTIRLFVDDGTNTDTEVISVARTAGDLVEIAYRFDNAAGTFYAAGRVNEGAKDVDDSAVGTPSWPGISDFANENAIGYGCDADGDAGGGQGALKLVRHYVTEQGAVDSPVDGTDPSGLLSELAAFHLPPTRGT